jgi:Icc protein
MNRRTFLRGTAAIAAAGTVLPALALRGEPAKSRRRVLRVAHLTDLHLPADGTGLEHPAEGVIAAIRHAQGQADRPDLILFGGDFIMDGAKIGKEEALAQWAQWVRIYAAEVKLPCKFALGNHDVWGWANHDDPAIMRDPDYGKGLPMRILGMKDSYYAFDLAGWHFVVLDSLQLDYGSNYGYLTRLDDDQFAWLARDLAATKPSTPVCVMSHVPILGVCAFVDEHLAAAGVRALPGILVHLDARRIKDLFNRHPNVKLCLSGHVHLADDVTYRSVRYCCNGAVCGNWWKGPYEEYAPAYALVDFYEDGSVENRLITYGGEAPLTG